MQGGGHLSISSRIDPKYKFKARKIFSSFENVKVGSLISYFVAFVAFVAFISLQGVYGETIKRIRPAEMAGGASAKSAILPPCTTSSAMA
jgi:hypothetical protein